MNVMADNVFNWNKLNSSLLLYFIKSRQVIGHLNKRCLELIEIIASVFCYHTKKQPVIHQGWKGVIVIKQHGRKHRVNRMNEILIYLLGIFNGKIFISAYTKTIFSEVWLEMICVVFILILIK